MARFRDYFAATFFLTLGLLVNGCVEAADFPAKSQAESNEYVIDIWQAEDGLPQNSVTAIVQAHDGYLWLLTEDAVARFDGIRFQVFDAANSPELASVQVTGIISDREGAIWLTTKGGGLLHWNDGHFERVLPERNGSVANVFGEPDGQAIIFLTNGEILQWRAGQITPLAAAEQFGPSRALVLRQDNADAIWFVCQRGQLVRLASGKFETITTKGLRGNEFRQLVVDGSGRLWIGTDKELALWQNGQFVAVNPPASDPDLDVRGLLAGAGGHVWMTANNKMWVWFKDQLQLVRSPWPPFAEQWTGDLADRKGDIWHSTIGRGLVRTSINGEVSYFTAEGKLPVNRALTLCQDREGNIWAGLEQGGLVRLRERRFEQIGTAEGIWARVTLSVCTGGDNTMWFGTRGGGLFQRRDGKVTHYDLSRAATNGIVFSMFTDRMGGVWAGTQDNGLFRFDGDKFVRPFESELVHSQVRAMYEDRTGQIWFGHNAGVFCWDQGRLKAYGANDGLSRPDVRAIAEDANGRLWVGTAGGEVAFLEEGHFIVPRGAEILAGDAINALHADADGSMWIGAMHGGLSHFKAGKLRNYSTKDALPDNHICDMLEDNLGNLWLGTYGGLVRVSKRSLLELDGALSKKLNCLVFNKADGLATRECSSGSQPAAWRTPDGHLLFATANGVVSFNADKLKLNLLPPPVVVEEILVNGLPMTGTQIAPGERELEFHFTAPSLSAPTKVRFRYKLEGLDANWNEAGTSRTAAYSYVPPGSYRFRVVACNNDGIWNETGATVAITCLPYIWETHWFQALALLSLLGGVAGAVRYVTRQRLQHKLALVERQRALERERARIAQDLHDDLGSSLTQINFLGALAEKNDADPKQARQDIARIREKAKEMVSALDEIVWTVNPKNDSLDELTAYLCHTAEDFFRCSAIRCRLDVPALLPKQALTTEVRHNLLLAVKEALNNIAKHSEASEVWLRIKTEKDALIICVEDNGLGLPKQMKAGSGDGLNNIRERLANLGGAATVQSQSHHGTIVELKLPLKTV